MANLFDAVFSQTYQSVSFVVQKVLQQISSNGRRPLPPECHGLVDQISWLA